MILRLGFTAPVSSTSTSSKKGDSLSLTTKRALMFLSRCRSTSAGFMAFPSHSNTSQPGVCNLKRWSLGKCLLPWSCRNFSWWPWVRTEISFRKIRQKNSGVFSQHVWAQSQKTDQHRLRPRVFYLLSPFGRHSLPGLTHVTFSAARVAGVTQSRNNTRRLLFPCSHRLKTSSNPVNSKNAWEGIFCEQHDTPWWWGREAAKLQSKTKRGWYTWTKTYNFDLSLLG